MYYDNGFAYVRTSYVIILPLFIFLLLFDTITIVMTQVNTKKAPPPAARPAIITNLSAIGSKNYHRK